MFNYQFVVCMKNNIKLILLRIVCCFLPKKYGARLAQLVKLWPADLAVPGLSPAQGEIFSIVNRGAIAHSLSLSSSHRPDMTEIL